MANTFSLDIVSEYELSSMINATEQAAREIATRYDFNGTGSKIEFNKDSAKIEIESNSELRLEAIESVLESKFIKAGIDLKFLDKSAEVLQNNLSARKTLVLVQGLDQAKAKQITAFLREKLPKAKTQIQAETVRVSSTSKDDLQAVMSAVRAHGFDFPVSFTNFR